MFIDISRRREHGVTLAELLVAMGISSFILTVVAIMSVQTAVNMAALINYVDLDRQSRDALDQMSWKVRNATALTAFSTNSMTFSYPGGTTLSYSYSSGTKKLTETYKGVSTVLLEDCNGLEFSMYQRTTISNTFDQYVTTTPSLAKVVQVSWQCSKSLLGTRVSSESVQSAKIVLRN